MGKVNINPLNLPPEEDDGADIPSLDEENESEIDVEECSSDEDEDDEEEDEEDLENASEITESEVTEQQMKVSEAAGIVCL